MLLQICFYVLDNELFVDVIVEEVHIMYQHFWSGFSREQRNTISSTHLNLQDDIRDISELYSDER